MPPSAQTAWAQAYTSPRMTARLLTVALAVKAGLTVAAFCWGIDQLWVRLVGSASAANALMLTVQLRRLGPALFDHKQWIYLSQIDIWTSLLLFFPTALLPTQHLPFSNRLAFLAAQSTLSWATVLLYRVREGRNDVRPPLRRRAALLPILWGACVGAVRLADAISDLLVLRFLMGRVRVSPASTHSHKAVQLSRVALYE